MEPMKILYVTGNPEKFKNAQQFFTQHVIEIEQLALPLEEIQASDPVEIAKKKAEEAFKECQKPLFVNDASWSIPALRGFPGPFMKYINQ